MTDDEQYDHVMAEIRAELARRRLHQKDLAPVLGISEGAISDRFRGATLFQVKEILRVADWLGVPASEWFVGATSSWCAEVSDLLESHAA